MSSKKVRCVNMFLDGGCYDGWVGNLKILQDCCEIDGVRSVRSVISNNSFSAVLGSALYFSCKSRWNCNNKCVTKLPCCSPRMFDVSREVTLQPPGRGDAIRQIDILGSSEVNW